MPTRPMNATAQQLSAAQIAISNSLGDADIKAAVAQYGYTTAKLNHGKALYEAALAAVNASKLGRGEQRTATADLKVKQKEAQDAYQAAAQVARAALPPESLASLGLAGKSPRTMAGLVTAGYTLFDNAALSGLLAEFGYDEARLAAERAKIEAYDSANQAQEAAKGAAQQLTVDQDAALAKMNDWLAQYLKIAKVALRSKKQLLEKIGVTARTTKTAAQRAAPLKAAATRASKKTT